MSCTCDKCFGLCCQLFNLPWAKLTADGQPDWPASWAKLGTESDPEQRKFMETMFFTIRVPAKYLWAQHTTLRREEPNWNVAFSCRAYDVRSGKCGDYEHRPSLCRYFKCWPDLNAGLPVPRGWFNAQCGYRRDLGLRLPQGLVSKKACVVAEADYWRRERKRRHSVWARMRVSLAEGEAKIVPDDQVGADQVGAYYDAH